ncbi:MULTISPECIES: RNA polymerase sigma factor [unclassified Isoptericola]|uniref:RNA polymerase sigma factor n=1 Tax=unclassified Isoptericola TaxID=2623355 RepID=UPI00365CAC19
MRDRSTVEAVIADVHRREWALLLAATVRVARDVDLAEECVQEAYATALVRWVEDGVPRNPAAWLTTAAKRRALDAVRRERTFRDKLPLLLEADDDADPADEVAGADEAAAAAASAAVVPDDRLRLVFLCCHPALAPEAQLALTLRLVCGVATADVARLLLVPEATMAARLTRAKKKISLARIPFRMPRAAELPDRLRPVLGVVHLLFTAGHAAPSGPSLVRGDLADAALHLARTLRALMPDEPEVAGLLALLLATDARRATRVDAHGQPLRLEDQDRTRWDRDAVVEAQGLVIDGLRRGASGRYVLQAAIAALHAEAPTYADTDWQQIVTFYDRLLAAWPTPVVALNRAVAVSMADGAGVALGLVDELAGADELARYHYLPAVRADLLERLGRVDDAAAEYRRALELVDNDAERAYLERRLGEAV